MHAGYSLTISEKEKKPKINDVTLIDFDSRNGSHGTMDLEFGINRSITLDKVYREHGKL
jgi:hypothetical protein